MVQIKMNLIHIFGLLILVPTLAFSESCPLPDPFDKEVEYEQTLFVSSTEGNDENDGTKERPYRTLNKATEQAEAGTQILLLPGEYPTGNRIVRLQGSEEKPIRIAGYSQEERARFLGGNQAMHLVEPRYVVLENISVEGASMNGLNLDDGGDYDTPAEHVILRGITIRHIGPEGNHDAIKLSGLDHFRVEDCTITDPSDGGSGIDMVGCHHGMITQNTFSGEGSNAIQAKGGTAHILIHGNRFENSGHRAINMGGSTGLPFFRPIDVPYEASNITVWGNIFIGAQTPIGFVGCQYGLFAHNTVYLPEKWALRILQENREKRFIKSSHNIIANNIFVIDQRVSTLVNIGPDTQPETFVFANNLWYHQDNENFSRIDLPGTSQNNYVQQEPHFIQAQEGNFKIEDHSPALGEAINIEELIGEWPITIPEVGDFHQNCYSEPASLGAFARDTSATTNRWE